MHYLELKTGYPRRLPRLRRTSARLIHLSVLSGMIGLNFVVSEANNVFGDTPAYIGVLDPLGVGLTLDADLYDALLEQLTDEITRCTGA